MRDAAWARVLQNGSPSIALVSGAFRGSAPASYAGAWDRRASAHIGRIRRTQAAGVQCGGQSVKYPSLRDPGPHGPGQAGGRVASFLTQIFGSRNQRLIRRYGKVVRRINELEEDVKALSDADLAAKTDEFRKRLADGQTLDD